MLQVKERRHPWRRLTTSHSRKTGRSHRLSPPVFFLTPPPARKRTEGPISLRLRKTCPPGGGTFLSPSSPRLPSLVSGGAGVRRIGGGTFSPPVGVGVGKPPLLFTQDFAGPGPVGELRRKDPRRPPPSFEYTQRSKEGAKNDAPPNEHRRPSGHRPGRASGAACFTRRLGRASFRAPRILPPYCHSGEPAPKTRRSQSAPGKPPLHPPLPPLFSTS